MKPFHRRDRAALICLRLVIGGLAFECGAQLLQNSWGGSEFLMRINHGMAHSPLAPEFSNFLNQMILYDRVIAQAIVLTHIIAGLFLLVGVLTRTSSLALCLIYSVYALIDPTPLPILVCVCCACLSLSDAGQHFTIQRLTLPTRANHQSTQTN